MPVAAAKINELTARKRLLVLESELNRQTLTIQLGAIGQRTARFERWASLGWKAYPLLSAGFRMARGFSANRAKRTGGLLSMLTRSLRLARGFLKNAGL